MGAEVMHITHTEGSVNQQVMMLSTGADIPRRIDAWRGDDKPCRNGYGCVLRSPRDRSENCRVLIPELLDRAMEPGRPIRECGSPSQVRRTAGAQPLARPADVKRQDAPSIAPSVRVTARFRRCAARPATAPGRWAKHQESRDDPAAPSLLQLPSRPAPALQSAGERPRFPAASAHRATCNRAWVNAMPGTQSLQAGPSQARVVDPDLKRWQSLDHGEVSAGVSQAIDGQGPIR